MQKSKRIRIIKDYVQQKKDVQISELTSLVDVSESTVRRDIKDLAKEGFLKELFGSIVLIEDSEIDTLLSLRLKTNMEQKQVIGKRAAALIKDNQFIYIDAGSTTQQIVKFITAKNITIVTNGIDVAEETAKYGFDCIMVGGTLKHITMAIVGEQAVDSISQFYFDISFIGVNGVSEVGFSTPDIREGVLKRRVILQSKKAYVTTDTTKMNKITSFVFANHEECELITELEE